MTVNRTLHVCLVCNTAWAIYVYRPGLLKTLLAHGVRVTVLAPRDRTWTALQAMRVQCIEIPMVAKGTNPLTDLVTLVALWRQYRALKPDVVFHYTVKPNIYGSVAAALASVKSVAVTTGLGYVFIQRSRAAQIARCLYKLAFRFPREVWFLNPDDQRTFAEAGLLAHPERARLLRSEGIDLTQFPMMPLPSGKRHFDFILVGRLLLDKGVAEYIAAARVIRADYPNVRFQLLGPADVANPSAVSEAEVQAWVAEGVVQWLGETSDVRPFLETCDCVVLPSYREGMPRTLLEASATGRPVIATRVPGCRDVVDDGITGLLCEPRDAGNLADKMRQMLELPPALRARMGAAGRDKVEREFDERKVVQQYLMALTAHTGAQFTEDD
jgi:glycosyltransferase involved in cell wall biosynthesis